jgi:CHAT domain-containing protein
VRSGIRAGIEPALLARERSVRARLTDKEQSRIHLLTSKSKPAAIASIDRDIRALLGELNDVESDVRHSSPRYATLVAPEPLSLRDVQQKVLDDGTALLEISLGATRSYLWTVTREGLTVKTLPGRAEIETLVRSAHTMVTAQDKGFPAAAKRLRNLLFTPVAAVVKNRRVVIVPDGALHYVPFAAVIPEREIVVLPSASVLSMMRRTSNAKRPTGVVAVVADPVFRADDPRVEVAAVTRSATSDSALPRLRFSRREAETVSGMVPAGKKIVALDFDASRSVLRRVGDYRIVHFATHALVDDVHPQLSSLVLSTVDAKGREANGHVPLYEIYNLDLGSELVVLSACQTAIGKEMRGEGIVSLTHGFMYAGAPRVLSTLWRIDDRATAELMKHFYAGMLRDGLAPAAALHRAQRMLAKDERWSAPYYWAGFVLQGEWR